MKEVAPRWTPAIAEAVLDACLAEIPRQMAGEEKTTDRALKAHHVATRQNLEAAAEELDTLLDAARTEETR